MIRIHKMSRPQIPGRMERCVKRWLINVAVHPKDLHTVYPKENAHGFCFAVLCCGYTLTDFPISIRLTSLALWQSNDCHSASKATLMNMDKYFMWIHYERLHNHNKAKHNKTVCIFLGIYCIWGPGWSKSWIITITFHRIQWDAKSYSFPRYLPARRHRSAQNISVPFY